MNDFNKIKPVDAPLGSEPIPLMPTQDGQDHITFCTAVRGTLLELSVF
jgi:hypothetical protein